MLMALIDEPALRLDAGPGVMAAQCRHLAAACALPSVIRRLRHERLTGQHLICITLRSVRRNQGTPCQAMIDKC
jgi:hypothetical protein